MYRNFTLTESERKEILEQHKKHGYGKSLNEDIDLETKKAVWPTLLKSLGSTSSKHIKMKDGDYSLNWGSHSGSGYDWGMSIAKDMGTFIFQTENLEKSEMVKKLKEKYGIPFDGGNRTGRYSIHNFGNTTIYDVAPEKLIGFIKDILSSMMK